jgi:hypothetical protein
MPLSVTKAVLTVLAVAAALPPANAQDCSGIKDAARRLQCFDAASHAAAPKRHATTETARIQQAVREALNDPQSARFGTLSFARLTDACQTVNAKNKLGGYTGDQQAMVSKVNGRWVTLNIADVSHDQCLEIIKINAPDEAGQSPKADAPKGPPPTCTPQARPEMPRAAIETGTQGRVVAKASIRDGRVTDVTILSGPRVFREPVQSAMMQYQCIGSGALTQEFVFTIE